jgi:predicted RNA-binding Zn ribbon-like protein
LNVLLTRHPAHPHLAKEDGGWRLHHHAVDAALVPMWTAICAEGVARVIGAGDGDRLGTCRRPGCGRVFLDVSKNGSRRFCSTTCQNRVKAAAFRRRAGPVSAGRPG